MNTKIIFIAIGFIILVGIQHTLNLILRELREIKEIIVKRLQK